MTLDSTLDLPRATDFVDPYFFFSNRDASEVTFVSPSIQKILGYDPSTVTGLSYHHFLCEGDPLNDDIPECQQADLSDGRSITALRSVKDSSGERRILLVHTVGVADTEGGPVVRRHNIARDVTESVQTHTHLMERLQQLDHAARQMTSQEREIANRILEGKMNRDIAQELDISDRTVERRRASIMKHLDAATTPELVSKLVERRMLHTWTLSAADAQWQSARNSHLAVAAAAM
ncbi:LuxR C-terminal-related transcriptional regulator [Stieleria sp. TO1_6]|uniref:LuxR C-terminal-related transcriptional regulator n=1 Tax=Stieleria tagensis TaxID=2956795 RepID=UPI00209BA474|nr:LuxR C-terminal-related transcriptional regulator [Stieleria tagensis]MCO8124515.1 LuxR C-terminal-related transcriptional regulator [Stieleria tagensis]